MTVRQAQEGWQGLGVQQPLAPTFLSEDLVFPCMLQKDPPARRLSLGVCTASNCAPLGTSPNPTGLSLLSINQRCKIPLRGQWQGRSVPWHKSLCGKGWWALCGGRVLCEGAPVLPQATRPPEFPTSHVTLTFLTPGTLGWLLLPFCRGRPVLGGVQHR